MESKPKISGQAGMNLWRVGLAIRLQKPLRLCVEWGWWWPLRCALHVADPAALLGIAHPPAQNTLLHLVLQSSRPGHLGATLRVLPHLRTQHLGQVNGRQENALHLAARHPRPQAAYTLVTALLIQKGMDPAILNARDCGGSTPLHLACEAGNDLAARRLLHAPGCDPNARNRAGYTPIFLAARRGSPALGLLSHFVAHPRVDHRAACPLGWSFWQEARTRLSPLQFTALLGVSFHPPSSRP